MHKTTIRNARLLRQLLIAQASPRLQQTQTVLIVCSLDCDSLHAPHASRVSEEHKLYQLWNTQLSLQGVEVLHPRHSTSLEAENRSRRMHLTSGLEGFPHQASGGQPRIYQLAQSAQKIQTADVRCLREARIPVGVVRRFVPPRVHPAHATREVGALLVAPWALAHLDTVVDAVDALHELIVELGPQHLDIRRARARELCNDPAAVVLVDEAGG
mmetsp:Transcript_28402/g.71941  ORF Transcript_28402/g.71941 Transcript_28402/m.71941 type:complete len:214 (+) Transcript_28402:184-825(+)